MSHVSVTTVNYVWSSNDFKPAQKLTLVFPIIIEKSICAPASYRVTSRHGHGGGQERSSRSSIQFQMPPQFVWHEYVCVRRLSPSERSNEKFSKTQTTTTLNLMRRYYRQVKTWHERNDWHFVGFCLMPACIVILACGDYFVMVVDWCCYDTQLAKKREKYIVRKNIYNCVGSVGCICALYYLNC